MVLVSVQAVREKIFWENYNIDMEALKAMPPDRWIDHTIPVDIKEPSGPIRKFLWDFFQPHYNCPLVEKVGVLPVRFHTALSV